MEISLSITGSGGESTPKKIISEQVYNRPQLAPFSPTVECDTAAELHTAVNVCDNVIIYVCAKKRENV